jgi:tetratricopeptide (TPR) repeat protein
MKTGNGLKDEGTDAFKQKDYCEAVRLWGRALVAIDPWHGSRFFTEERDELRVALHNNRAMAQMQLFNFCSAVADTTDVLHQHPDNVKALFRRGQALAKQQKWAAAAADLQRLIKLKPNDKKAAAMLATAEAGVAAAGPAEGAEQRSAGLGFMQLQQRFGRLTVPELQRAAAKYGLQGGYQGELMNQIAEKLIEDARVAGDSKQAVAEADIITVGAMAERCAVMLTEAKAASDGDDTVLKRVDVCIKQTRVFRKRPTVQATWAELNDLRTGLVAAATAELEAAMGELPGGLPEGTDLRTLEAAANAAWQAVPYAAAEEAAAERNNTLAASLAQVQSLIARSRQEDIGWQDVRELGPLVDQLCCTSREIDRRLQAEAQACVKAHKMEVARLKEEAKEARRKGEIAMYSGKNKEAVELLTVAHKLMTESGSYDYELDQVAGLIKRCGEKAEAQALKDEQIRLEREAREKENEAVRAQMAALRSSLTATSARLAETIKATAKSQEGITSWKPLGLPGRARSEGEQKVAHVFKRCDDGRPDETDVAPLIVSSVQAKGLSGDLGYPGTWLPREELRRHIRTYGKLSDFEPARAVVEAGVAPHMLVVIDEPGASGSPVYACSDAAALAVLAANPEISWPARPVVETEVGEEPPPETVGDDLVVTEYESDESAPKVACPASDADWREGLPASGDGRIQRLPVSDCPSAAGGVSEAEGDGDESSGEEEEAEAGEEGGAAAELLVGLPSFA